MTTALVAPLFPEGVVVVERDPAAVFGRLFPEEEASIACAVEKRRREFAAGRLLAREALGRLGVAPGALPVGEGRAPRWPQGVVGSIAHTRGLCAVAVAHAGAAVAGLGVDVEPDVPLKDALLQRIALPAERDRLARAGDPARLGKLLFCAKEALYKAQYPATRTFLGFHDVELELDPATGRFSVRAVARGALGDLKGLSGVVRITNGFVVAGAVLSG